MCIRIVVDAGNGTELMIEAVNDSENEMTLLAY